MSHIMPDLINPDLLFAALLVSAAPLPAVEYAVRLPFDDYFGPSSLFVAVTPDRASAESALGLDGTLVQRSSITEAWTEVAR